MPIIIRNEETEALARKLAKLTGESITDAVRASVAERYERLRRQRAGKSLADELNEIGVRCARLPAISSMTDDEILGYDEFGAPTR
ncbi:MAG: type II toxin-antitoxin system VapB family antitoxin [Acidobacteriota bacterium]